ncbi:MAG TPA: hypothetical protein VNG90_00665 [Candidatus Acidoferrum sp.]|nr:hypothetical protein [Candidatus Acidoferrum sp.]
MSLYIKKSLKSLLLVPILALNVMALTAPAMAQSCGTADTIQNGIACAKPNGAPTVLFGSGGVFTIIINAVLFIIGMIAVVMLIIGAVHYVTSGGDAAAVNKAKNTILYAIIGVVLSFMAYAIINFVVSQFNNATK